MLMLCWFYCIPFAKFLYFASAPLVGVVALFALKRGVRQGRVSLRQTAFFLLFLCAVKVCLFDIRMLKKELLCGAASQAVREAGCSTAGFVAAELAGLILMLASSFVLFHYYRKFMNARPSRLVTPAEAGVGIWANLSMGAVVAMVVWQMAPWVGYLTVGSVPAIFAALPWQALAVVNLALLLTGFWKAEGCAWDYDVTQRARAAHLNKTWNPRDTLWMATFVYLLTLALSYVAHDVLRG